YIRLDLIMISVSHSVYILCIVFFFKQKMAYDLGLGIPDEPLFRSLLRLAVIHLLMEAKHWGLRKSRNATSLNSRFKSLDTLKVKIGRASCRERVECSVDEV